MNSEKAILEKLEQIEERQKLRLEEIEKMKKNLEAKAEKTKNETKQMINKSSWIQTAIVTVPIMILLVAFNLLIRKYMGEEYDFGKAVRETLGVLPIWPVLIALFYFTTRKTKQRSLRLCDALEEVAKGNLNVEISLKDAGPYKKTYSDFNKMVASINSVNTDLQSAVDIANEANEAKSAFLSNMSHEIRTPINAVLGLDEMIIRESRERVIRGYASDIKSAGRTLLALINDVLDTSKIEAGKLEIIPVKYDLSSVINDLSNTIMQKATDKGLKFEIKVDEKMPHLLKGDENRIKQCILNLLSNGVKYTDEGTVTLELSYARLAGDEILLSVMVSDTGRGIKEEDLEKLCAPFVRIEEEKNRNIEGTGLGMNITKNLLKLMDSELRVDSKYGAGSTFKFSVKQEVLDWQEIGNIEESFKRLRDSEEKYEELFQAPDAKILVVDDSSVNLMIVEGLLKKTLVNLILVESGKEAVELCKKNKYDLLLIDHMMPGMDGIEVLHHIKEDEESINKDSPSIALTANAVMGAKDFYLKEGFTGYLSKPIEPEKLEEAIKEYLNPSLVKTENLIHEKIKDLEDDDQKDTQNDVQDEFLDKMATLTNVFPNTGLEYSGSLELYKKVVSEFADTGFSRADTIEGFFEAGDFRNYTIQVHALKSAARIVGATPLSLLAAALEDAGNAEDSIRIQNATPELLRQYRQLVRELEALLDEGKDKEEIDDASIKDAFTSIKEMVDGFDFDSVDSVMDELKKYKIPEKYKEIYGKLKTLVAEVARDDILLLLEKI